MRLAELLVFCFGNNKGFMYLGVVFGGLAFLLNIAVSSIMSKHTTFDEQVGALPEL